VTSRTEPRTLRRFRRPLILASGVALLAAALVPNANANLAGSSFEGNDGNMIVNTGGNTDWVNAPNRVRGDDLASGSSDNAFGQGTKEDDPNVSVVTGSIPPQKSDLIAWMNCIRQTARDVIVTDPLVCWPGRIPSVPSSPGGGAPAPRASCAPSARPCAGACGRTDRGARTPRRGSGTGPAGRARA